MLALRRFLSAIPLLTGALAASPLAAAPQWAPLGPYGGFVDTLTADPAAPQVLYATANRQGTFKSVNGGATWTLIHTGYASGNVAVDPSLHATIYQSIDFKQMLKSTNGGATWSSSSRGLPNANLTVLAVDPAKRNRVYAATDGVWHSLDGGLSWKGPRRPLPVGAARHVLALAVARRPSGTVYAATEAGVFRSVDAGDSWKPSSRGLPPGPVTALALAPSNPQILWAGAGRTVFHSMNSGATWRPAAGLPFGAGSVSSLAVAPGDPSTVWVGTLLHGVYRTTDGGAHWTPAGPRTAPGVAALAATTANLYAAIIPAFRDPGGVLASGDGGGTWQARNTGLFALETLDAAIDPHHPEMLWAAAFGAGLYRSTVGGQVWDVPTQSPPPFSDSPVQVTHVAFSADGAILDTVFNDLLWTSDNAGASWHLALGPQTVPAAFVTFLLTHPLDAMALYAGSGGGQRLFASHDSGATWQPLEPGFDCAFNTLAAAPSAPATLYAGGTLTTNPSLTCHLTRAALFRSTDGGATWTRADNGLAGDGVLSLAVDPFDPRTLYAQSGGRLGNSTGVSKSLDGGATWSVLASPLVSDLVFSAGGGTLWGNQGAQVFASRDGGASWQSVGGPTVFNIDRLIPDPVDPDRLYAATSGGVWVFQ
ncbi:MAG TPA: hypothetical protein VGS07_28650 [Thermoanaerobaculia bacterium]|jgi:photosystem II stability/assembly factor-like uncharacterized protein|nr:hypothetical protein [Thermoanaerobaculia bacterium]